MVNKQLPINLSLASDHFDFFYKFVGGILQFATVGLQPLVVILIYQGVDHCTKVCDLRDFKDSETT